MLRKVTVFMHKIAFFYAYKNLMENYGHESLGTQIDGMNFQTHFRACLKKAFCKV